MNVHRQRLQRRHVQRVQPFGRLLRELADRRQEAGEGLAGAGRRDKQRAAIGARKLQHLELVPPRLPTL